MQLETSIAKALARVFIAAAWSHGPLQEPEANALKDLLYHLPSLHKSDWEELQEMLDKPVTHEQAGDTLNTLARLLDCEEALTFAAYAVECVTGQGDGPGTPPQRVTFKQLQTCLNCLGGPGRHALRCLYRLIRDPLEERTHADDDVQLRRLSETRAFLDTRLGGLQSDHWEHVLDPEELRRLSLAGILLSFVIHADDKVDENEILVAEKYLHSEWGLSEERAQFVVQVSLSDRVEGIDLMRICRWFYEATESTERLHFLDVLFDVGMADGHLDETELEMITLIAADLKCDQYHFQAALERVQGQAAG